MTLLETMVCIVIAVTLLSVGIPGFIEFIRDARRDSRVVDVVESLNFARSEAVRSGMRITLCPSVNGETCNDDARWEMGWIVFADPNSNGAVDGGEAILRRHDAMVDGGTVRGARFKLVYRNTGYSMMSTDTLRICDERGTGKARRVVISNVGRVRVLAGAASCP